MAPMQAMDISIPKEKRVDREKARLVEIFPGLLTYPTIKGMLVRWQGLNSTLRMPQANEAAMATRGAPSTAWESVVKSFIITSIR